MMLSSENNIETIAQLIEAVKHYLGLQTEYVKLDVIDKLVMLVVVLESLSLALAFWLSHFMSLPIAFLLVAVAQIVLLLIVNTLCRPWIERRLVRYLAKLLLRK